MSTRDYLERVRGLRCVTESWRPVPGFDGLFDASDLGRVRIVARVTAIRSRSGKPTLRKNKAKVLGQYAIPSGHMFVGAKWNGKRFPVHVGRLVLMAFCGPPQPGLECCHNDGDPTNNMLENLRWDTHANNNRDKLRHGTQEKGSSHHAAKLTEAVVAAMRAGTMTTAEACAATGASYHTAYCALTRRSWRHVG